MIRAALETTFLMVNIIVQNHFRVIWFKYHCLYESLIRTNKSIRGLAFFLSLWSSIMEIPTRSAPQELLGLSSSIELWYHLVTSTSE